MKKCEFGKSAVKYFGHIVASSKFQMDKQRVQSVKNWPAPTYIKNLKNSLAFKTTIIGLLGNLIMWVCLSVNGFCNSDYGKQSNSRPLRK